jgi:hypothetical protein
MLLPTRPVIAGFHPDPSVCRVGADYYLATSSFEYAPGLPIFHSTDLRSWKLIGHALTRPSQLRIAGADASGGVFAPTLRHHNGRFWVITTNVTDGLGEQLLVTTEHPAGSWSEPIRFRDISGIDPDLCWGEDGTCYMTWCGFGDAGFMGIQQVVVDPTSGEVLTEPRRVWQGSGGASAEGPHLYRVEGRWYLLIAEGGTERGHAATIARAELPGGPFEPCPWNPLITARGSDGPVQSTGHADLLQRPDGTWVVVYLGSRPRGSSPQWHVLGRETFASEITWADGWPELGDPIEPQGEPTASEELATPRLPLSWVAPARFPDEVLQPFSDGWRMTPGEGEDTFAGRRQEHLYFDVEAALSVSTGAGGLQLRIDPRHWIAIEITRGQARGVAHIGSVRTVLGETPAGPDVIARIWTRPGPGFQFSTDRGPDEIVAGVVGPSGVIELGRLDGRYVSTEVAGGMTGRLVGVFCESGTLTIRSFTYTGRELA